ncbi:MAG TPA: hypothetical protein VGQ99_06905 [Tepidisphaeraceae bacterium]|jgi:hypothetical protein|nr:hypothetical protein [Tepidisphaeraceae bacterium]
MNSAANGLMLQFLTWVSSRPRTYGEAMETWKSSCPRYTIWEDALVDGLIEIERADPVRQARVTLTVRGKMILNGAR